MFVRIFVVQQARAVSQDGGITVVWKKLLFSRRLLVGKERGTPPPREAAGTLYVSEVPNYNHKWISILSGIWSCVFEIFSFAEKSVIYRCVFWIFSRVNRTVTFFAVSQQKNAPALCSCLAFADSETGVVIFLGCWEKYASGECGVFLSTHPPHRRESWVLKILSIKPHPTHEHHITKGVM